jgi:hypothetical protein
LQPQTRDNLQTASELPFASKVTEDLWQNRLMVTRNW